MLNKKHRLYMGLGRQGVKKISFPYFTLKYFEISEEGPRFAFVASKKVDKRAVVRNSVKRKMSKAVEEILEKFSKNKGYILTARKEIITKGQSEISREIKKIISENI